MNRWGQMAQAHWVEHLPTRLQALGVRGDREAFFTDLGDQAASQIEATYEAILTTQPPGLPADQVEGWRAMARKMAEERVIEELILIDPAAGGEPSQTSTLTGESHDYGEGLVGQPIEVSTDE